MKTSTTQPHLIPPPLCPALTLCIRGTSASPWPVSAGFLCCCAAGRCVGSPQPSHSHTHLTALPIQHFLLLPACHRAHTWLFCFVLFISPSLLLSPLGSAEEWGTVNLRCAHFLCLGAGEIRTPVVSASLPAACHSCCFPSFIIFLL